MRPLRSRRCRRTDIKIDMGECRQDSSGSGLGPVTGCCEDCNDHLKGKVFPLQARFGPEGG